jgi:hypothetical protein
MVAKTAAASAHPPQLSAKPISPAPAPLKTPPASAAKRGVESAPAVQEVMHSDPLGILAVRSTDSPSFEPIQVGAVTTGKQHQITVPLEMSVEGRKVRLQLKMTLTLSR